MEKFLWLLVEKFANAPPPPGKNSFRCLCIRARGRALLTSLQFRRY